MHHKIYVVEQYPFGLVVAFFVGDALAHLLQPPLDFVGDGLHLPRVDSTANQEIVRKSVRFFFHFKNRNTFRFLILASRHGFGYLPLQFFFLQFILLHKLRCRHSGAESALVTPRAIVANKPASSAGILPTVSRTSRPRCCAPYFPYRFCFLMYSAIEGLVIFPRGFPAAAAVRIAVAETA